MTELELKAIGYDAILRMNEEGDHHYTKSFIAGVDSVISGIVRSKTADTDDKLICFSSPEDAAEVENDVGGVKTSNPYLKDNELFIGADAEELMENIFEEPKKRPRKRRKADE